MQSTGQISSASLLQPTLVNVVFFGWAFPSLSSQLSGHVATHEPQPIHFSFSNFIFIVILVEKICFVYKFFVY